MKFQYLALCLVLGTGFSLVSGTNGAIASKAPLATAKPTAAPLMMSTAKPTMAPKMAAPPTKAIITNTPPKVTAHKMAEPEKPKQKMGDVMPMKAEHLKTDMKVADAKPVQVTGFITKTGDIYEIEGKGGIGMIEGRQSEQDKETIVCNYGSVVIYSDVPCEQVTNVHVGEVQDSPVKQNANEDTQAEAKPQVNENEGVVEDDDDDKNDDLDDFEGQKPRGQNNRNKNNRRRGNNNNNNRRRNGNRRGNGNRQGGNGVRNGKPQKNQQQRRKLQQQKRKQQMKRQQQKRRQQQQQQQFQDDYDDEEEVQQERPVRQQQNKNRQQQRRRNQNGNNNNNNRRYNQRRQQANKRAEEYSRGRGI